MLGQSTENMRTNGRLKILNPIQSDAKINFLKTYEFSSV